MVVCNPETVRKESESVAIVTPLVPVGEKETAPVVVKLLLVPSAKLPFIVVVPDALPS